MKKMALIIVACILFHTVHAQGIEGGIRVNQMINLPLEYKVPASAFELKGKMRNMAGDIFVQFVRSNNSFLRFRLGMASLKLSADISLDAGDEVVSNSYKASVISFAPGFGEQIVNNKIVFKGRFELPVQILGKSEIISDDKYSSGRMITTIKLPSGYAIGLGVFAGFSYNIIKHLAIGSEFGFGFRYLHINNEVKLYRGRI